MLACQPLMAAQACLDLERSDSLSRNEASSLSVCLKEGNTRNLSEDDPSKGLLPVNGLRIDPGLQVVATSQPNFRGQLWQLDGTLDNTALARLGIQRSTLASVTALPTACFYPNALYQGKPYCLGPDAPQEMLFSLSRDVSSIRIPQGVSVRTFTQGDSKGKSARFTADADATALWQVGMHDAIQSVQVAHTHVPCSRDCVIPLGEAYDLPAIFGKEWKGPNRLQTLLTFDVAAPTDFVVRLGDLRLRFTPDAARGQSKRKTVNLPFDRRTKYVALALDRWPGQKTGWLRLETYIRWQLVELDADRKYIRATPRQVFISTGRNADVLSVRNLRNSDLDGPTVKLATATFATVPPLAPRDTGCNKAPDLFLVANYLFELCKPASKAAEMRVIAGETFNRSSGGMVLGKLLGNGHNPMALHAAARVCRQQEEAILNPRKRRGADFPADCIYRTATIITSYQALFGRLWGATHFTRIIENILRSGSTGYAGTDALAESQLVQAVLQRSGQQDNRMQEAVAAFHEANALYGVSVNETLDLESAANRLSPATAPPPATCPASPLSVATASSSLAEAEHGALGTYEMDLTTYTPRQISPRVFQDGQWVAAPAPFTISRIDNNNSAELRTVVTLMDQWNSQYSALDDNADSDSNSTCSSNDSRASLAGTGASMASAIGNAARRGLDPGVVIFVVSFQGQPVSVLEGAIMIDGPRAASVDIVVSAPTNVVAPFQNGAVRGAGSFALQQFLAYARTRGMQTVITEAISKPSAIVKAKAGFHLTDEL